MSDSFKTLAIAAGVIMRLPPEDRLPAIDALRSMVSASQTPLKIPRPQFEWRREERLPAGVNLPPPRIEVRVKRKALAGRVRASLLQKPQTVAELAERFHARQPSIRAALSYLRALRSGGGGRRDPFVYMLPDHPTGGQDKAPAGSAVP